MFGKKPLLAKKRASKVAFQMANVVDAIDALLAKKAIKIEDGSLLIFREILQATHAPAVYVKNLFLYCRLKKILKEGQTLYIKDIETGDVIAQYTSEKAYLYL